MKTAFYIFLVILSGIIMLPVNAFTAQPVGTCSVTPLGGINFGNYDIFSTTPVDATGTIQILCDRTQPSVEIDIGPSPNSGGFNPRQMKHSSLNYLFKYNLYTDAGMSVIWGDGAGGTSTVHQKTTKNVPLNVTIYGRIPAGQDVYVGSYGETLTVTIIW
jgi:spore coat protein U-like protein